MRLATDGGLWRGLDRLTLWARQVLGAPDYEAYVEHCRRRGHAVRLTRVEYVREFLDRKGSKSRCC